MKRTSLLFLILVVPLSLIAQERVRISTPEVSFINNILTVRYDLTGCGAGDFINIRLIVLNSKGDTIKPGYVSGDIGSKVNCGFGKKIDWNVVRDNILVDEDMEIQVAGKPVIQEMPAYIQPQKTLTRGDILLSSALVPGLGQKKASGKGRYLAFSGLVYGTAAASLAIYFRSMQLYDDYKAAPTAAESDNLYKKIEKTWNTAKYLGIGAAGLWTVNMIWSAAIPVKEGSNLKIGLSRVPENGCLIMAKWTF